MALCPVCAAMGLRHVVDEDLARKSGWCTEHRGKVYCEDSEEHHRMFAKDPERFLRAASEKGIDAA